jgi:membrane dipeptidase
LNVIAPNAPLDYDAIVMHWIDGHIDLAYIALQGRNILETCSESEKACISIPDLEKSPISTFFGTIYTSQIDKTCGYGASSDREAAFAAGAKQLEIYKQLELNGHLSIQRSGCNCSDSLSMLLLMEGGDPIRSPEDVRWWSKQGLRIVGLTWSSGTRYAGGNDCNNGISDEGIELVAALDEHNIVHDASHLSDQALDDLFSSTNETIVASHSNSRTVLKNQSQRHLKDEHAKEIFRRGGVIGLNLYTQFLSQTFDKENTDATIADCVEHIMYYCDLAGNKTQVALGSDFDGGFPTTYLPINLKHPNQVCNLAEALVVAGFSDEDLASFARGAWMRVLN